MAFSAAFSGAVVHFKPPSASRRETNSSGQRIQTKNTKPRKLKSRNFQPQPPYLPSTVEGGDATTFTRLPPKDDFGFDSLASQSVSEVIKLAECKPRSTKPKKSDQGIGKRNRSVSRIGVSEEKLGLDDELGDDFDDEGEDESIDGSIVRKVGFENGKFELYQVGSGDEDEDEDEEDEDEAIDGSRVKKVGYEQGRFELYQVGSDDDDDEEDEDDDEDEEDLDGEERLMAFGDEEEEGAKEREKGVPAVMRCFDRAKIFVKAGDGGNGVVAFRREKYVPLGGPSGGDGGRGGNVYMEVDRAMNSLLPFRKSIHFRGGRGSHGQGQQKNGAKGEDVVIKVPPGTVVRKSEGDVLFELLYPGQKALLLPGGRGGRGNAAFKSGTNKAPKIAENGEEGLELWLELELKLVADVGIVGVPNAGKSTLLSVISAAQPAIANYPFTTLLPNLGVVSFGYDSSMVVADLPGLLEGAHRGFGLGHEFLRHTERCSVLVHIVDGSSEQPEYEFDAVRLELEMFSPELSDKPYIVAYNKMDLPEASEKWPSFREALQARGFEPFCMSAATRKGTQDVTNAAYALVQKNKADEEEMEGPSDLNYMADMMQKQRAAPISEFEISHDSGTSTWHVEGVGLQRFVQMTNWRYMDSDRRFQGVLEACGVNKSLTKLGVKEGDTVVVGGMELVWYAGPETGHTSRRKGV